jgi:hypothetical protein
MENEKIDKIENEEQSNSELEDILKNVDQNNKETPEDNLNLQPDDLIYSFLLAVQGITQVIGEHTQLKSVVLTDQDLKILTNALQPLKKYIIQLVNYIIYLPLITFMIGYSLRIVNEMKNKKKLKKNEVKNETV